MGNKDMLGAARSLLGLVRQGDASVFGPFVNVHNVDDARTIFVASVVAAQAATGELPGVGEYGRVHAPRTILACELSQEDNAALLKALPDEWLKQNKSGTAQVAAYTSLTNAHRVQAKLAPFPASKSRGVKIDIFSKEHRDFIGPASFVSDILVAGTNLKDYGWLGMLRRLGHAGVGCLLCEAIGTINDLEKKGISIPVAIEWLDSLMDAPSGPFHTLREEIDQHRGMTPWALAQRIARLEKKGVNSRGISELRSSHLVTEHGVVAMGATP